MCLRSLDQGHFLADYVLGFKQIDIRSVICRTLPGRPQLYDFLDFCPRRAARGSNNPTRARRQGISLVLLLLLASGRAISPEGQLSNNSTRARGLGYVRTRASGEPNVHGRFLRLEDFSRQDCAIQRKAV
jgi:hypothetical protein